MIAIQHYDGHSVFCYIILSANITTNDPKPVCQHWLLVLAINERTQTGVNICKATR
jgi:hypothetical protein